MSDALTKLVAEIRAYANSLGEHGPIRGLVARDLRAIADRAETPMDVDDELATAAALLEVSARAFAFFKDDDQDIGTVREALKKAAVAYTKAEQRFGVELLRMTGGQPVKKKVTGKDSQ